MRLPALLMAGGRGTRLGLGVEKPLVKIAGRPLINYVVEALKQARYVERVVVVASRHTPNTYEVARGLRAEALKSPGEGYIEDLRYAVKALRLEGPVLVVACDLPLLSGLLIDHIVRYYFTHCSKPSLAVVAPYEVYEALGIRPSYVFEAEGLMVAPSGINVLDASLIDEEWIDEELLVLRRVEVAVNINTLKDLQLAERLINEGGPIHG
ncbi:MAG: nucleotidyltransferase [Thermoprotei archaeon]|nr:MAG: nucleotidyltransferase [Thermoprotei archaeon]